jgi:hypothetical protein
MIKIHHTDETIVHVWVMECVPGADDWDKMHDEFEAAFDWVDTDPNYASMLTTSVFRDPDDDETDIWDDLILPLEEIGLVLEPHFDSSRNHLILLQRHLSADFSKVSLPGYKYCGSVLAKVNQDFLPEDDDPFGFKDR